MNAPTKMGLVTYALGIHLKGSPPQRGQVSPTDPLSFLETCRRFGAGGMQTSLGIRDIDYAVRLRRTAESYGMHIEGIVELPRDASGIESFEKQIRTAKDIGATIVRTVMLPGRRYEQFKSAAEFKAACEVGLKALQMAEPVAAQHRVRLALENHKDHRIAERLALIKQLSSEYIGLCVDVGNNLALVEDPLSVVKAFTPWALTVHFKDQGLREYEEGFLLADVPLGAGCLPLAEMINALKTARPEIRFNLEVITRDPLKVPVLTERYWSTMPDVSASDLAEIWHLVKRNKTAEFPMISQLPQDQQLEFEKRNVEQSVKFAAEKLGL